MNLTKSLKWAMVCAGVTVLSASAGDWIAETFDFYLGSPGGTPAGRITGWTGNGDDSKISIDETGTHGGFGACTTPLTNATDHIVLELNTEGTTLTRDLTGGLTPVDFEFVPVYVDMMVKFVLSEDTPAIPDGDVKALLYANVDSNLVVYAGVGDGTAAFSELDAQINPDQWYRLTLEWFYWLGAGSSAFTIQINGASPLTSEEAGWNEDFSFGGSWFLTASQAPLDTTLVGIEFQGTGFIDELVVTDILPDFGDGGPLFAGVKPVDPTKYNQWKSNYNVGNENPNMWKAYHFNVKPGAAPLNVGLQILTITQNGTDSLITIGATDGDGTNVTYAKDNAPLSGYAGRKLYPNGTLYLRRAQTLGNWDQGVVIDLKTVGSSQAWGVTVDNNGNVTVDMTGGYNFIQATLDVPNW